MSENVRDESIPGLPYCKNGKVLVKILKFYSMKVKLPLTLRNILSSSVFFGRNSSNADAAVL